MRVIHSVLGVAAMAMLGWATTASAQALEPRQEGAAAGGLKALAEQVDALHETILEIRDGYAGLAESFAKTNKTVDGLQRELTRLQTVRAFDMVRDKSGKLQAAEVIFGAGDHTYSVGMAGTLASSLVDDLEEDAYAAIVSKEPVYVSYPLLDAADPTLDYELADGTPGFLTITNDDAYVGVAGEVVLGAQTAYFLALGNGVKLIAISIDDARNKR